MRELDELLSNLEPAEALTVILPSVREALGHLDADERQAWLLRFLGDNDGDKLAGMVNL